MASAGADAKFQPIYVGTSPNASYVPWGCRRRSDGHSALRSTIYTLRISFATLEITGRPRPIIALGPVLGRLEATALEHLPEP
jgi:hypothetical protein